LSDSRTGCQPAIRGSLPRTFLTDRCEHDAEEGTKFHALKDSPGKLPGGTGWQPVLSNP